MALDPTKWESPFHAYNYWYDLKHEMEKEVRVIKVAFESRYGIGPDTNKKLSENYDYRLAIGDETFAREQCHFYAAKIQIRLLSVLLEKLSFNDKKKDE